MAGQWQVVPRQVALISTEYSAEYTTTVIAFGSGAFHHDRGDGPQPGPQGLFFQGVSTLVRRIGLACKLQAPSADSDRKARIERAGLLVSGTVRSTVCYSA